MKLNVSLENSIYKFRYRLNNKLSTKLTNLQIAGLIESEMLIFYSDKLHVNHILCHLLYINYDYRVRICTVLPGKLDSIVSTIYSF